MTPEGWDPEPCLSPECDPTEHFPEPRPRAPSCTLCQPGRARVTHHVTRAGETHGRPGLGISMYGECPGPGAPTSQSSSLVQNTDWAPGLTERSLTCNSVCDFLNTIVSKGEMYSPVKLVSPLRGNERCHSMTLKLGKLRIKIVLHAVILLPLVQNRMSKASHLSKARHSSEARH